MKNKLNLNLNLIDEKIIIKYNIQYLYTMFVYCVFVHCRFSLNCYNANYNI